MHLCKYEYAQACMHVREYVCVTHLSEITQSRLIVSLHHCMNVYCTHDSFIHSSMACSNYTPLNTKSSLYSSSRTAEHIHRKYEGKFVSFNVLVIVMTYMCPRPRIMCVNSMSACSPGCTCILRLKCKI